MKRWSIGWFTLPVAAAVALCGCTTGSPLVSEQSHTSTTPATIPPTSSPTTAPPPGESNRCSMSTALLCDPELGDGVIQDLGPREFATGEAVLDENGVLAHYVVAEGDIWDIILDRFPNHGGLWSLNCYRTAGFDYWPGDIINLNPATITSVGSYQGTAEGGTELQKESCLHQTGIPPQV